MKWLGKISVVPLDSGLFLMKADCCASGMSLSCQKEGPVKVVHCSCMAGMSEKCNRVAAMLFSIETAVSCGLTKPSCTEKPSV